MAHADSVKMEESRRQADSIARADSVQRADSIAKAESLKAEQEAEAELNSLIAEMNSIKSKAMRGGANASLNSRARATLSRCKALEPRLSKAQRKKMWRARESMMAYLAG